MTKTQNAAGRVREAHAERERRMVQQALAYVPKMTVRQMRDFERGRLEELREIAVANAERLTREERK